MSVFQGAVVQHMDPRKYLRFIDGETLVNGKPVNSYCEQWLMHMDADLKKIDFATWKKRYPNMHAVCMVASHTPAPQKCTNAKNYNIGGTKGKKPGRYLWYWIEYNDGSVSRPMFIKEYKTGKDCIFSGFAYVMSMCASLSDVLEMSNPKKSFFQKLLQR